MPGGALFSLARVKNHCTIKFQLNKNPMPDSTAKYSDRGSYSLPISREEKGERRLPGIHQRIQLIQQRLRKYPQQDDQRSDHHQQSPEPWLYIQHLGIALLEIHRLDNPEIVIDANGGEHIVFSEETRCQGNTRQRKKKYRTGSRQHRVMPGQPVKTFKSIILHLDQDGEDPDGRKAISRGIEYDTLPGQLITG